MVIANRAARRAFDLTQAGQPLFYRFRDPEFMAAAGAALRERAEKRFVHAERGAVETVYEVCVTPLEGFESGALITFLDRTEIRRTEAMRVDFIANASHELRTPLASVLGFIETLQGPARDDPAAREKFLAIMAGQARRMARLVDDLLSLSRVEMHVHVRPRVTVDLAGLARQTVDALSGLARESGLSISLAAPAQPAGILGDRDELLRLVENLVENAIKYGKSGGKVEVAVAGDAASGGVTLSVSDDGPGIAAEHIPRLTERFYRVDTGSSRAKGGTGLGLALVKHIANRHRATLTITSAAGEGSRFTVRFPLP